MNSSLCHFEKYSVAPCPSRDYYVIKILQDKVILYTWKISYGPHFIPTVRVTEFSKFNQDKSLKEEIEHVFGSKLLNYLRLVTTEKAKTLLTLPAYVLGNLVKYLNLEDIAKLFCVSQASYELFHSNVVWESLYKKLKGTSRLAKMEKNLSLNQGFKQLVKEQHGRNSLKKSGKIFRDETSGSRKLANNEKASISLTNNVNKDKVTYNDLKSTLRKPSSDGTIKKDQKPSKAASKFEQQEKIAEPLKRNSSESKGRFTGSQNTIAKHWSGESFPRPKLGSQKVTKSKSSHNSEIQRHKLENGFANDKDFVMQKKYLKTLIMNSYADEEAATSEIDAKDMMDDSYSTSISPKTIFTKSSCHALRELKTKPTKKKSNERFPQGPGSMKYNLNSLVSQDKNDDSDDSGMSYLMKRYLQTSDDAARTFAEAGSSSQFFKNSSTQANMDENSLGAQRKPSRGKKLLSTVPRPKSGNVGSTGNLYSRFKALKRT